MFKSDARQPVRVDYLITEEDTTQKRKKKKKRKKFLQHVEIPGESIIRLGKVKPYT